MTEFYSDTLASCDTFMGYFVPTLIITTTGTTTTIIIILIIFGLSLDLYLGISPLFCMCLNKSG